jgi:hypothetical protein
MVAVVADEAMLLREGEMSIADRKRMPLDNLWCGLGWRRKREEDTGQAQAFYGAGQAAAKWARPAQVKVRDWRTAEVQNDATLLVDGETAEICSNIRSITVTQRLLLSVAEDCDACDGSGRYFLVVVSELIGWHRKCR